MICSVKDPVGGASLDPQCRAGWEASGGLVAGPVGADGGGVDAEGRPEVGLALLHA